LRTAYFRGAAVVTHHYSGAISGHHPTLPQATALNFLQIHDGMAGAIAGGIKAIIADEAAT